MILLIFYLIVSYSPRMWGYTLYKSNLSLGRLSEKAERRTITDDYTQVSLEV